jgi:hypothetical protein
VLSDLQGKPCSRGYQDAGGQHARMILAGSQKIAVRLYLQPQRAAFRPSSVPLWSGVGVCRTGPRGMSGAVQGATLHHTRDLTRLRHAAAPQKPGVTD